MAKQWTLAELRAQFRIYTGRPTQSQITDAEIDILINDYYQNYFPDDGNVNEFDTFYTQELSATDDGIYAIPQSVDRFDDPITIDGNQIRFYRDREAFFSDWYGNDYGHGYPFNYSFSTNNSSLYGRYEDEQYVTEPDLVIGSSDSTKVKNIAFSYKVNNYSYSKAITESDLTGSAVPQGKYGAWSLRINSSGTISVKQANSGSSTVVGSDLNEYVATTSHTSSSSTRPITGGSYTSVWQATGNTGTTETWQSGVSYSAGDAGFDTPRIALEALTDSDSESAYMGYVTVIKSDGAFTPATTALDAANVTATFTDGRFEARTTPTSALLYGQNLYIWPKPNDIYQFKALQIADRPDELTSDSSAVADPKWGPAIAIQTANTFLLGNDGDDIVQSLASLTNYYFDRIKGDKIKRLLGGEIYRRF